MMKHLGELKEQLGWQGMSGIALLVLAGAFNFLVLQPMEQEAAYVHSRLDAVHAKSKLHGRTFDMGDRQKELGEFFDSLPDEQDVTDILGSISVIAEASGVQLKQAEYHLDEKSKPRLEYGMYFPVQGGYANIRQFVFRVLADHSAIALDQINFQRDKVNDSILKAEVRLTLFLRR